MQNVQTNPRIYVACLAAYNNGYLHGQWIEANQEAEVIHAEIQEMLSKSPIPCSEEFAIHDYEGFCGIRIEEYEGIETVAEVAAMIAEHGEAWAKFAEYEGIKYATLERFEEAYTGTWESEKSFAEDIASETMEIPDHLYSYIDFERLAHDLFINDYYSAQGEDCQIYVFRRL